MDPNKVIYELTRNSTLGLKWKFKKVNIKSILECSNKILFKAKELGVKNVYLFNTVECSFEKDTYVFFEGADKLDPTDDAKFFQSICFQYYGEYYAMCSYLRISDTDNLDIE